MTAPSLDPDRRRAAARIGRHSPQWVVIWGTATREFWAFPVFQVPAGTIAHHGDPAGLTRQMHQIQTAAAYHGHRETPQDAPGMTASRAVAPATTPAGLRGEIRRAEADPA